MAGKLYNLADFVNKLMPKGSGGFARRKAFNDAPDQELANAGVSGRSLQAFLTFDKTEIAIAAMEEVALAGGVPADLKKCADWIKRFADWKFPPGEEKKYTGLVPPVGIGPKYANPSTQVYGTVVTGAAPNLTLTVYVEGALTGSRVVIVNDGSGATVLDRAANADAGSTFRYARITLNNVNLPAGNYRSKIVNDLKGANMTIDTPTVRFIVP